MTSRDYICTNINRHFCDDNTKASEILRVLLKSYFLQENEMMSGSNSLRIFCTNNNKHFFSFRYDVDFRDQANKTKKIMIGGRFN